MWPVHSNDHCHTQNITTGVHRLFVPPVYPHVVPRKPDPAQVSLPFDSLGADDEGPPLAPTADGPVNDDQEPRPRRGRPRKWASEAERKRAYRERLAADLAEPDRLRRELRNANRRVASRDSEIKRLRRAIDDSARRIARLEREAEEAAAKQETLALQVEFFRSHAHRAEKRLKDLLDERT